MDVLVGFARTGRIGPLHCGMPLTEAEDLLGPGRPHPAIRLKGTAVDGYPHFWDGLELAVTRRTVSGVWINLRPGTPANLPALVLPDSRSFEATVSREELAAALDRAGCEHHVDDTLTFGRQSCILTKPADVRAVFSLPGQNDRVPDRDRHYLRAMHRRAPDVGADRAG